MSEYYCHVKTTPNMEIGVAVRMSVSFPGKCSMNQWSLLSTEKIAKSALIYWILFSSLTVGSYIWTKTNTLSFVIIFRE